MGIRDDQTCSSCEDGPETATHFIWKCCASKLDSGKYFVYTFYTLIIAEPYEIHLKITWVLITFGSLLYH